MLSSGKSNKEIATELNLSAYTVESHRTKIMEKLNFHSITDLVRFAMRCGLVINVLRNVAHFWPAPYRPGPRVPCSVETIKPCSSKGFR